MFTFQHNTHFSQAVACSREKFWEEIRLPSTSWNIDSRRAILTAVEQHDEKAIKRWLKKDEYRKFLLRKKTMKKEASKKKRPASAWSKRVRSHMYRREGPSVSVPQSAGLKRSLKKQDLSLRRSIREMWA